jgi:hypothetical protein
MVQGHRMSYAVAMRPLSSAVEFNQGGPWPEDVQGDRPGRAIAWRRRLALALLREFGVVGQFFTGMAPSGGSWRRSGASAAGRGKAVKNCSMWGFLSLTPSGVRQEVPAWKPKKAGGEDAEGPGQPWDLISAHSSTGWKR